MKPFGKDSKPSDLCMCGLRCFKLCYPMKKPWQASREVFPRSRILVDCISLKPPAILLSLLLIFLQGCVLFALGFPFNPSSPPLLLSLTSGITFISYLGFFLVSANPCASNTQWRSLPRPRNIRTMLSQGSSVRMARLSKVFRVV